MAITQEAFDGLVKRLEQEAARDPRGYHLKLGAFAALGYVYVFAILLLLAGLAGLLVAALFVSKGLVLLVKKLLIPIVVFIGLVARSLWVRLDAPTGLELARTEHPQLFALIDEVRAATRAPGLHSVLLDSDLNAGVVQVPRLGLFGWQRNYLLLGLPLMQLTTPAEFKAVLAHEFGHLSGAHGKFGAWIYRVRTFWAQLANALEREEHWGSFLFVPFFRWYAPRFAAWSFVKARQQEYEADRLAAETVGVADSASALVRIALTSEELGQRFWPAVFKAVEHEPEPAARPFFALGAPERRAFRPEAGADLDRALGRNTSNGDTHPCLRERILALDATAAVPAPVQKSAAEVLLGPALGGFVEHFDTRWRGNVTGWWRERHAFLAGARDRVAAFEGRELDDAELEEYAGLTAELKGDQEASALFEELLRRKPGHAVALFIVGRARLSRGEDEGIALVEEAMIRSNDLTLAGCDLLIGYLHERGRDAESRRFIELYQARHAQEAQAAAERGTFRTTDTYEPHSLSPEQVAALAALIEKDGRVKQAYLVDKSLHGAEAPVHVVGIEPSAPWYRFVSSNYGFEVVQALASAGPLPVDVYFLSIEGGNRKFRKIFRKVRNSRIYPR
jgi:Zn-dependent protease with chaperone function